MFYYLKLSSKHWWVFLVMALITTGSSIYLSYFYLPKEYKATTTMYVLKQADSEDRDSTYQDLLASEMLVKDYKEIVKTGIVIREVKEDLQDSIGWLKEATIDDISDKVGVAVKTGTRIIEVSVTDQNPAYAAQISNKIAEVFRSKSLELIKTDNVSIINEAVVPHSPVSPNPTRNILLGFLSGITGALIVVLSIDYIKRKMELERSGQQAVNAV
ncbi:MAG: YveK family protein [Bacillota bacterium]